MNTMVAKPKAAPTSTPSAWIVTNNRKDKSQPSDKGRKSVKNGKVYLDDEQEFEIELHNPLQECVLCDIKLNGQSISATGLVLRPGQRFYLDCFIDDKKKFIFNTYEVDDTKESNDSIAKNGLLEVYFYKEDVVNFNNWRSSFDRVIIEKYYPLWYEYPYYYPNRIYYGSPTVTINPNPYYGTLTVSNGTNNCFTVNNSNTIGTTTTTATSTYGNFTNTSGSYTFDNGDLLMNCGTLDDSGFSSQIETGRVEKGTASAQKFEEIDMQFQSMYIAHTVIQLLPNSRKPIETREIVNEINLNGKVKVNGIELKDILKRESNDVIELIKKLADLHSAGILTDDEFNNKKSELLSKI